MNDVEPGLLGFLVVAGIGVALVFLVRSMNKQFRKLGPPPDETAEMDDDGETGTETGDPALDAAANDATAKGAERR